MLRSPLRRGGVFAALAVLGATVMAFTDLTAAIDKEAYQRGLKVYEQRCFFCHGEQADGNGPLSAQIQGPKPRDFRLRYLSALHPDSLKHVIQQGGEAVGLSPMMPSWEGVLSPQEIDDVVVFIQTVSRHGRVLTEEELTDNPTGTP